MNIDKTQDDNLRVFTVVNRPALLAWLQFGTYAPPPPLQSLPLRRGRNTKLDSKPVAPVREKKVDSDCSLEVHTS